MKIQELKDSLTDGGLKVLIYGKQGSMKAQPYYSEVLTPNGFVKMGKLKRGDKIFNNFGKICEVEGIYEQGKIENFELTFDDGSTMNCNDDHLFEVYRKTKNKRGKLIWIKSVLTLSSIIKRGIKNFRFPTIKPIDFGEKEHIISPYLLGILLGDGWIAKKDCIHFSTSEDYIVEAVKKELGDNYIVSKNSDKNYSYRITHKTDKCLKNKLFQELVRLKLNGKKSNEKFIPNDYLFDSIKNRFDLLCGLIDTDGSVSCRKNEKNKYSVITFSTTSEKLMKDFLFLARSLSYIVSYKKKKQPSNQYFKSQYIYVVTFKIKKGDTLPFKSKKHKNRYNVGAHKLQRKWKKLTSVKKVKNAKMRCIRTSSKNRLYITDGFNITHNTRVGVATGRTFILSLEKGHRTLQDAKNKITVATPNNIAEVREAYQYLIENKDSFDTVIIDSITELSNMVLDELQQDEFWGDDKRALKMWGELSNRLLKILKSFRDIQGINVVLIALEDAVEENYKTVFKPLLDGKKTVEFVPALYDVVLRFEKQEGKIVAVPEKDRTGQLLQPIEIDFENHLKEFFKNYIKKD